MNMTGCEISSRKEAFKDILHHSFINLSVHLAVDDHYRTFGAVAGAEARSEVLEKISHWKSQGSVPKLHKEKSKRNTRNRNLQVTLYLKYRSRTPPCRVPATPPLSPCGNSVQAHQDTWSIRARKEPVLNASKSGSQSSSHSSSMVIPRNSSNVAGRRATSSPKIINTADECLHGLA